MHEFSISSDAVARIKARSGKIHPFDTLDARRTALLVIDLQNYFLKPGAQGETPAARALGPPVNDLAAGLRSRGGPRVWIRHRQTGPRQSCSPFHECLTAPERQQRPYREMEMDGDGY